MLTLKHVEEAVNVEHLPITDRQILTLHTNVSTSYLSLVDLDQMKYISPTAFSLRGLALGSFFPDMSSVAFTPSSVLCSDCLSALQTHSPAFLHSPF